MCKIKRLPKEKSKEFLMNLMFRQAIKEDSKIGFSENTLPN